MQFWDQPTRGLDSKTALGFAEMLRAEADRNGRTIVATMYQAGNGIYNKFDKVLVLADGCVIYYGPANTSQRYFESLGFVCPKGANVADFLTSVTVTTERVIAPGFEGKVPNTPQEFERAYRGSSVCRHMHETEQPHETLAAEVDGLKAAVQREKKERRVEGKRSVYTVGLRDQIVNCTIR
jgi:ATP-binding cassette, subfamily G (WHITE), member 2, SNQ2